jgi:fatty-acyl-CoA synthase
MTVRGNESHRPARVEAARIAANPFVDATAGGMLAAIAGRFPDREALVATDRRLTYAEMLREAQRFARALLALGVRKDDKVALWLPNRPTWLFAQYGGAMIGAVIVALNPRYRAHELAYILKQADVTTLLLTDHLGPVDFLDTLGDVLPGLMQTTPGELAMENFPLLRRIIVDAEDPYPGCLRLSDVLDVADAPELETARARASSDVHADDPFTILFTSGTTSFPKGAVISHRNCVPHAWYCGEVLRVTERDRVLHALPFSGTWGGLCIPQSAFSHGACLVMMEAFEPAVALSLMEREGITIWNAVDAMAIAVLDHPDLARTDRSALRTGGFGMTGGGRDGLFDEIVHTLGVPHAYQPYGMTELNALCLHHWLDETEASRAEPGVWPAEAIEVRVVHPDTGTDVGAGEEGEMWFRGRLVTRGYYKKPEETAKAFSDDGWFKTGDLARRGEDGRVVFKGRLREVLRISHFMVAPAEIEAFIMQHPSVLQAFVFGVPDPKWNEAAVAYVIARPGSQLTPEDVIDHCRGKIASYKVPRHVRIVDDVPRTPGPHGDKAQKGAMREMFLAEHDTSDRGGRPWPA